METSVQQTLIPCLQSKIALPASQCLTAVNAYMWLRHLLKEVAETIQVPLCVCLLMYKDSTAICGTCLYTTDLHVSLQQRQARCTTYPNMQSVVSLVKLADLEVQMCPGYDALPVAQ